MLVSASCSLRWLIVASHRVLHSHKFLIQPPILIISMIDMKLCVPMGCEDFKCDRNYVHFLNANLREYREYRNTRDFVPSP